MKMPFFIIFVSQFFTSHRQVSSAYGTNKLDKMDQNAFPDFVDQKYHSWKNLRDFQFFFEENPLRAHVSQFIPPSHRSKAHNGSKSA